jgi:oxygen-dependent protoporphyrinogen oxidase
VTQVAVIGGGIAGLSAAEAIRRRAEEAGRPVEVTVLEAADRPGGKITTQRSEGFVVESGPHGFLDKEPAVLALIERLGLQSALLRADEAAERRYVFRQGRLRALPKSPPGFLSSGLLPFGQMLRVLGEPWVARRGPEVAEESVFDFARRRIGHGAAEVLVDAMVSGIYAGDPRRLSVDAAFPALPELEKKHGSLIRGQIALAREKKGGSMGGPRGTMHSFKDGLGTLIAALAGRAELRTGFRVERLERRAEGGFRLLGPGGSLEADRVVATAPAYETAALVAPFAEDAARGLAAIPYAAVAVVVQAFDAAALGRPLDGFGFLVPDVAGRRILGSIWASSVFPPHAPPGAVMLRTILGGVRHPEHAEGTDEEIGGRALGELVGVMGLPATARPQNQWVLRWPRAIPQYEIGHAARVEAARTAEERLPGLYLGGNALQGVALIQCVLDAERLSRRLVEDLERSDRSRS